MDQNKKNEFFAFSWFVISVLTLVSLVTYTPDDIAFEVSLPNSPIRNFAGPAGAYIAWFLMLLFGKTAYFLVPLFLFWALAKWVGKKSQHLWLKIFSSVIFFASACALFSLIESANETSRFHAGGITGYFVSIFLSSLFGNASFFVAASLFILSLILATELLVLEIAKNLAQKIRGMVLPAAVAKKEAEAPVRSDLKKPAARAAETLGQKFAELKDSLKEKERSMKEKLKVETPPAKPEIKMPVAERPAAEKPQIKLPPVPKEEKPRPASPTPAPRPSVTMPTAEEEAEGARYELPALTLLQSAAPMDQTDLKTSLEESSQVLEDTLRDFQIDAKVVEVEQGPTITRYELQPAAGVKVQRITSLENDIALAMRATSVRIVAPIPGKSRVGIEVPNASASTVYLKEVLASTEFQSERAKLAIAIGKDTAGAPLVCNLADMPHMLIAGATNTGKSVCINSIVSSLLFRATPDELKFVMIDPKMVELHFYNDLPHLLCPVITDKSKVPHALAWLLTEMERRYKVLSKVGAKNLLAFNTKVENKEIRPETLKPVDADNDEPVIVKKMPYIVLIIDELADLMMASAQEVETAITRLAQLARAVGIHMILATQRPSVDVITGVIKANFPARIAFQVASKVDSRTILDENGADKLLGRGDMLLMDPRKSKLIRAQGAWVQDAEIEKVTAFIKAQRKPVFDNTILPSSGDKRILGGGNFERDEIYLEAKRMVLESGQASVSMVQRRLGVGYTRAARLMDMMEEDGIVGPYRGAKPREILVELPNTKTAEAAAQTAEDKEES